MVKQTVTGRVKRGTSNWETHKNSHKLVHLLETKTDEKLPFM